MSTDGVKIIDGNTAHDTYWNIMDLYDRGATFETINSKVPFPQSDYYDDFDYEIYTTSYALAIWEIGLMTDDVLQEVKKVILRGACVNAWTNDHGIKLGKQRQKELDKLWNKIVVANEKIRKRKKFKIITNFLFDINEVLSFQLSDNNFYATVLLNVNQYKGECNYEFGKIIYKGTKIPTISQIADCEIIGRKIHSGHGMDMGKFLALSTGEMLKQGGLEEILQKEAERTGSYVIGMSKTVIDHRELINISEKFIKVGTLDLKEECRSTGSLRGASTFDELTDGFEDLDNYIKTFGGGTFMIKDLLKT
jgi:hypothetical protein